MQKEKVWMTQYTSIHCFQISIRKFFFKCKLLDNQDKNLDK